MQHYLIVTGQYVDHIDMMYSSPKLYNSLPVVAVKTDLKTFPLHIWQYYK